MLITNVFLLRNVLCVYLWMFMYYIKDLEFKKCKYVNVKYTFYNARVIQLHYYFITSKALT